MLPLVPFSVSSVALPSPFYRSSAPQKSFLDWHWTISERSCSEPENGLTIKGGEDDLSRRCQSIFAMTYQCMVQSLEYGFWLDSCFQFAFQAIRYLVLGWPVVSWSIESCYFHCSSSDLFPFLCPWESMYVILRCTCDWFLFCRWTTELDAGAFQRRSSSFIRRFVHVGGRLWGKSHRLQYFIPRIGLLHVSGWCISLFLWWYSGLRVRVRMEHRRSSLGHYVSESPSRYVTFWLKWVLRATDKNEVFTEANTHSNFFPIYEYRLEKLCQHSLYIVQAGSRCILHSNRLAETFVWLCSNILR